MSYAVKEIHYTLQGEGAQTGRGAVFLRFAGCNLWSGHERDRTKATCRFCDTDFVGTDGPGGGHFADAEQLANAVTATWAACVSSNGTPPFVVCTGGEPLLQLDEPLVRALHAKGFQIAIETNGTRIPPPGIDWICCSPKVGAELVLHSGDELKFVYPQHGADPQQFLHLNYNHFFLQPMDGPERENNTAATVAYCRAHPKWRLSGPSLKE